MTEEQEDKAEQEVEDENSDDKSEASTEDLVGDAKKAAAEIKAENDRRAELIAREEKLQDRKESIRALGGGSMAGDKPPKPAKMTDTEYAEALQRGEVNPLKEDGFIK